jgi:hypothetical protein
MDSDSESVASAASAASSSSSSVPWSEASDFEATEPDTLEDFYEEADLHWLSVDQIQEMHEKTQVGNVKVPPPLKDWVEIHPRDTTYQVTFGKARRVLWEQYKQEHNLFMHNVSILKSSTKSKSLQTKMYEFLFGTSSDLAALFMTKLQDAGLSASGVGRQHFLDAHQAVQFSLEDDCRTASECKRRVLLAGA